MKPSVNSLRLLFVLTLAVLAGSMILLSITHSGVTKSRTSVVPTPMKSADSGRLPALSGEAAIEHLKQQGQYESLAEAMKQVRYNIQESSGGNGEFYANNAAQKYQAAFSSEGVEVRAASEGKSDWRVGLKLRSVGYGTRQMAVSAGRLSASGNRIEYERSINSAFSTQHSTLKEWYQNRADGLEQGFTLTAPPGERRVGERLRVAMSLAGDLRAKASSARQTIELVRESGESVLRYEKLLVTDAQGRKLSATMGADTEQMWLEVDDAGAVYPVTIDPTLAQQAKLTANDGAAGDNFGATVTIDGVTAVVGAWGDDIGANTDQGSAYVFVRSGTTWSLQQKLTASDGAPGDGFGTSVAISGETIVVGAIADNIGANADQGSAYVFVRSGTTWSLQQKLTASDGSANDLFGSSVAVSVETIVVGAHRDDIVVNDQGSVYVFVRASTIWSQQQKLTTGTGDGLFGSSVAIDGETIVVGAPNGEASKGAAFVFVRTGTTWSQQQKLTASDGATFDLFGEAVAISGETIVVGVRLDDIGVNNEQGSAYVFVRSGTTWSQQQKLIANDGAADDQFGTSVAVSDDTIVVGAITHDIGTNANQGAAYVFMRTGTTWNPQQTLTASDGVAFARLGRAVAIDGETIVVSSVQESAYIFASACAAPAITAQPNPVTVCAGASTSFSVTASGTSLTYQWRKGGVNLTNGGNISGADTATLTINPASANDAALYDVVVTGSCGTVTSASASLTVNEPPVIISPPVSQTKCIGEPITFSVSASGTGLSYQWRKGGIPIAGATGSSYNIPSVSIGDAANYDVLVSGTCGGPVTSSAATLSVIQPATIATQPVSQTVTVGAPVTFSVAANGTAPFTYQWRKNNVAISGANSNTYTIAATAAGDAGSYDVVVNNTCNTSVTSNAATLTVNNAPTITAPPITRQAGTSFNFFQIATVNDLEDAENTLVVRINGVLASSPDNLPVNGVKLSALNVTPTGVVNANVTTTCTATSANFTLRVTDTSGAFTEATLVVTIITNTPPLLSYSGPQILLPGGSLNVPPTTLLSDNGRDIANVAVQGVTPAGFTGTINVNNLGVVSISNAGPNGTYTVTIRATDNCGMTKDASFTLVVNALACSGVSLNQSASSPFNVGDEPSAAVSGDFNNDGNLDLAVSNYASDNVSVLLGNGMGSFSAATNFNVGDGPSSVATGYFDSDGILDLVVSNRLSNNVSVLLGNGTGGFGAATNFNVGTNPVFALLIDLNSDGRPDILTANYSSNNLTALLGDGVGGVIVTVTFGVGTGPIALATGDFNLDGRPDIAVSNQDSDNISVFVNSPTGFTPVVNFNAGDGPYHLAIADYNQDQKLDIAVANLNSDNVSVLLGNGAGSFGAATNFNAGDGAISPVAVDLDGDGKLDLALANETANNISVLLGNGAGGFGAPANFNTGDNPRFLAAGDYNKDGKPDLAVTNSNTDNVTILLNNCVACSTLTLGPSTLSNGTAGVAYTQTITASGGTAPYSYAITSGSLPNGLTLSSSGVLSGTPTAGCNFSFTVTATDANSCTGSQSYTLFISDPPTIISQPVDVLKCAGQPATFSVAATGAGLTYQWRRNGVNISGAISSSFTIPSVSSTNAGLYTVVVSGSCGVPTTSEAARLTVSSITTAITAQPVSITRCEGQTASFSVTASGAGLTYQWRKNTVVIPGATSRTLNLSTASLDEAGSYDVMVSGVCGDPVTSTAATLTVNPDTVITTQPVSQTVCVGTAVSFSAAASGTGPFTYQWRKGNTDIPGATSSSFSLAAVTAADAGSYRVVVTGGCDTKTSAIATLTVNTPPVIVTPPVSITRCEGQTASFSVTATGAGLTYQWRKDGINISGANSRILNLGTVELSDAGAYDVVVSGTCGTVVSGAELNWTSVGNISVARTFHTATMLQDGKVLIAGGGDGSGFLNSAELYDPATGTWSSTGSLNTARMNHTATLLPNGKVLVVGGNIFNDITSSAELYDPATGTWSSTGSLNTPRIEHTATLLPDGQVLVAGGTYTQALGSAELYNPTTGTWSNTGSLNTSHRKHTATLLQNGKVLVAGSLGFGIVPKAEAELYDPVTGIWSNTGSLNAARAEHTATLMPDGKVLVTGGRDFFNGTDDIHNSAELYNPDTGAWSNTGSLSAVRIGHTATLLPGGRVLVAGGLSLPSFTATAELYNPVSGNWSSANSLNTVRGGHTATLLSDGRVLVAGGQNDGGNINGTERFNSAAILTVNTPITITTQPVSQTVCVGATATFSVTASGTGPFTYQWRKGNTDIPGATSSSLTLASVTAADAGSYRVVVTSSCGSKTSATVSLNVNESPVITAQPVSITRCEGQAASFSVTASGAGLTYQWYKNAVAIDGATSRTLNLGTASLGEAGSYYVVVSGVCGDPVTSAAATLTVNPDTVITTQPVSQMVCVGATATFSVTASGTGPFTYQWRKGNTDIPGATSSSFSLASVTAADAGSYRVVITGACSSVTSAAATLTIGTAPVITAQPTNRTVNAGATVSFSVTASGTAPLTYQWRRNGINIVGATSRTYTITGVTASQAGSYDVVVSGGCSPAATSNSATLTVN